LAHTAILPDFRVLFKVQVTKTVLSSIQPE
jgi:hypothetical protein